MTWFPYSVAATVLFGISTALYKLPGSRGQNRAVSAVWMQLTLMVLALLFLHGSLSATTPELIALAAVWGCSFALLTYLQMVAVSSIDTSVVFPITSTLSLILTVLAGLVGFHESVHGLQIIGILLAVTTIFEFLWRGGSVKLSPLIWSFGLSIVALSAFNKIVQKIAADHFNVNAFQIWQYVAGVIAACIILFVLHRRQLRAQFSLAAAQSGASIGAIAFTGTYLLYQALQRGPLTLITSIHSTYIFITALAAWIIFGEKLTARKLWLAGLAAVSIVLMRLG